jgi:hypothetical protein
MLNFVPPKIVIENTRFGTTIIRLERLTGLRTERQPCIPFCIGDLPLGSSRPRYRI